MKLRTFTPYILWACATMISPHKTSAQNTSLDTYNNYVVSDKRLAMANIHANTNYNSNEMLTDKADNLCDIYIDNMITSQQKLAPYVGTPKYHHAVSQELTGAPVGRHCVYGQYIQLQRALNTTGDTLTIIPQNARTGCLAFKRDMRTKYAATPNCIFDGRMFQTDSAYSAALQKYLDSKHIASDTALSERKKFESIFAKHNFCITSLEPGAMLIVPRTWGAQNQFHMIMLVGRGYIQDNMFIPDPDGQYVFSAHNSEKMGYLFKTWDTSNVFAANTKQIIRAHYAQELAKIDTMSVMELINFISPKPEDIHTIQTLPINILRKMAYDKYFNKYPQQPNKEISIDKIALNNTPVYMLAGKKHAQHTI